MEQFILIADDDPALSKLVQTVVEGEGYVAATAKDGKDAYNALKSGAKFVGAIIDLSLIHI